MGLPNSSGYWVNFVLIMAGIYVGIPLLIAALILFSLNKNSSRYTKKDKQRTYVFIGLLITIPSAYFFYYFVAFLKTFH
jgi:hypothetical protein